MRKVNLLASVLLIALLISGTLQAGNVRILFIGDSVTDGNWGGGGGKPSSQRNQWDMNHIYGHGFMFLCAAHYMNQYPEKEYEFFNRGISGNTLYDLEKRWQEDVIDMHPDVLSILVGINDVCNYMHGDKKKPFNFEAWELKYRELLDKARAGNPNLKIVIASPFVAYTGAMQKDVNFDTYNEMVHRCISIVAKIAHDYHAVYLPYQSLFDQLLQKHPTSQSGYWIWDGIHPTAAGHQRMAEMWIRQMNKKSGYLSR